MKRALLLLLTCLGASLQAANWGCYCCPPYCSGELEVGGEVLFFKPDYCDWTYAVLDERPFEQGVSASQLPQGPAQSLNPSYDVGFRFYASYIFEDSRLDLTIQYSAFHTRSNRILNPTEEAGYWPTTGQPEFHQVKLFNPIANPLIVGGQLAATAEADLKWEWDGVDLYFGSRCFNNDRLWIHPIIGLHYTQLKHILTTNYKGTINPGVATQARILNSSIESNRKFWGIGPMWGLEMRYALPCNFGLAARGNIAILAGGVKGKYLEFNELTVLGQSSPPLPSIKLEEPLLVVYDTRVALAPYLDLRLGINYTFCCGACFQFVGEVGYEFVSYINAMARTSFNDKGATGKNLCYNFNMHGLYLMGRFQF